MCVCVRINEKIKNVDITKDLYLYIMRSRSIDGTSLVLVLALFGVEFEREFYFS